jgi:epoxide hydrolase 4
MRVSATTAVICILSACSDGKRETGQPSGTAGSGWHEPCPQDAMEERMMDIGGISLNVACRGTGKTVVFLHGFPEFHYSWKGVMDELASEYRLVAPDQRGYNVSDKPTEVSDYGLPVLAGDILALLPLVSPEPALLVAHDWGGPVAWLAAHHSDAHIRGLVAANAPHPGRFVHLLENDPAQIEASAYMDFFRQEGSEAFITPDTLAADFQDILSPEDLEVYIEAWSQPGAITGGLNWYRANLLTSDSIEEMMDGLAVKTPFPATVLWGLEDEAVLAANAEGLDDYVEDLQVETFPGVDHWIEHHIPGEIARAVRELDARSPLATDQ